MPKYVMDVGNCAYDHGSLTALIERNFDAKLIAAHGPTDTMMKLKEQSFSLVIVNRKLDRDQTDGMDIILSMKEDPEFADIPVMMLTNFPEYQKKAEEVGAVPGFGKNDLGKEQTVEKLRKYLA